MSLSDEVVGVFSPRLKAKRQAERAKSEVLTQATRSLRGRRGYEAARHNRLTRDWRVSMGSADAEIGADLPTLRARSRDLVMNNPYIASAVRQLVANLVGDGIEARAIHSDPRIQKLAQEVYLKWAASRVDGRHDFYGQQRQAVRSMIVDGDVLVLWSPDRGIPDARMTLLEGDFLDTPLLSRFGKAKVRNGVEYATDGARAAYHLLDEHPGDPLSSLLRTSRRVTADQVDHLFDPQRPGQSRGVPWFVPSMRVIRELRDLADAVRTKKKLQACIGIIRTLSDDDAEEPDTGAVEAEGAEEPIGSGAPAFDRLTPGMVVEGLPGEQFTAFTPTPDGDSDVFYRQELRSIFASVGLPDYLATGDVSQANYSSLRASKVGFNTLLDDWQANVIVPYLLNPAFARLMRRKALELQEPRLAEVTASWTPPPRAWVDPIKDVAAKIMEQRAGFSNMREALAERGIEINEHIAERRAQNEALDAAGIVWDTDPRKVNGAGALQPPAGFVLPKGDSLVGQADRSIDPAAAGFFGRMIEAVEANDGRAINAGFIEAATAVRSGSPSGPAMVAIIAALTGADEPENRG